MTIKFPLTVFSDVTSSETIVRIVGADGKFLFAVRGELETLDEQIAAAEPLCRYANMGSARDRGVVPGSDCVIAKGHVK